MNDDNPYRPPEFDFHDESANRTVRHHGPDYAEARSVWPRCSDCGKRIEILCPFCKTEDNLFPLGDSRFWSNDLGDSLVGYQKDVDRKIAARSVLFGDGAVNASKHEHGCKGTCSGQETCSGHGHTDSGNNEHEFENEEHEIWMSAEEPPMVIICPTCAEPFVPDFPEQCKRCRRDDEPMIENDFAPQQEFANAMMDEDSSGVDYFLIGGVLGAVLLLFFIVYFLFS